MPLNQSLIRRREEKEREAQREENARASTSGSSSSRQMPASTATAEDQDNGHGFRARMSRLSEKLASRGYDVGTPNALRADDIISGSQNQEFQTSQPRIDRIVSDWQNRRDETDLLDFWGNSRFGNGMFGSNGGEGTGFNAFGGGDVTTTTGNRRQFSVTLGTGNREAEEQAARDAALNLVMQGAERFSPSVDAGGNVIDNGNRDYSIQDTILPVYTSDKEQEEAGYFDNRILEPESVTYEQVQQNAENQEDIPFSYRVGAAGRAVQNSVYNYISNALGTLEALNDQSPEYYGIDTYEVLRQDLNDAMGNISERAQRDLDNGYIPEWVAQTIDTGTRMLIDAAIYAAGGAAFGGAAAATGATGAGNAVLGVVQNPAFYSSMVQQMGDSYEEYMDAGVDREEAQLVAFGVAALNSILEVQGGSERVIADIINRIPIGRGADAVRQYLTNALEEAAEEAIQAPVSNVGAALTYDPGREIFNGEEMLGNAGSALLSSLVLGGIGLGVRGGVNAAANQIDRIRTERQNRPQEAKNTAIPQQEPEANTAQQSETAPDESRQAEAATDLALRMAAGENVAQTEAAIRAEENTRENEIEAFARTLGERGGTAYRNAAPRSGTSAEAQGFRNSFEAYYDWGLYGQDFNTIDTAFGAYIDEAKTLQAFRAGQNDAAQTVQVGLNTAPEPVGDVGLTTTGTANAVDQNTRLYLDQMGRALGVEIQIENAPVDEDGRPLYNGRVEGNTIYLSAQSENNLTGVLNHELTHILQQRDARSYQSYRDTVAAYLEQTDPGWMQGEINRIIQGYAAQGQTVSREEAIDDIVADAAERFLIDPEAAASTVQTNKSLARRILDAIKDILQRLSNIVRGGETQTRAAQMLEASAETYRQAEEIWTRALSESVPEEQTARSGHHRRRDRTRTGVQPARAENGSQARNREQLSEDVGADEQIDLESLNQEVAEMLRAGDDEVNAEVSALRAQAQILQNATVSEADINSTVDRLAAEYGAEGTEEAARLKTVVNDAMQTLRRRGEGGFSEALSAIYGAARDAVGVSEYLDDSVYNDPAVEQVRNYLRTTRIYVPAEIRSGWTDWGAFRKKNNGQLRLVNSHIYTGRDGMTQTVNGIDQAYMELQEMAPNFFPDDLVTLEDELLAMSDFWDAIQPTYTRRFDENRNGITMEQAEAAMNLTTDILANINASTNTEYLDDIEKQALRGQVREYQRANRELQRQYRRQARQIEQQTGRLDEARTRSQANAREARRYRLDYERTLHRYVRAEQDNLEQQARFNSRLQQERERLNDQRAENRQLRQELRQTQREFDAESRYSARQQTRLLKTQEELRQARQQGRVREQYARAVERERADERVNQAVEAGRERLNRQREQAAARVQRVREQNRVSRERAAERRRLSAAKRRIERVFNRLARKVVKPSDTQHIPENYRAAVADFLQAIDFSRMNTRESGLSLYNFGTTRRITNKEQAWRNLRDRLQDIANNQSSPEYEGEYIVVDPDLIDLINWFLQDERVKKQVDRMNSEEAEYLYRIMRAVEKSVSESDNIRIRDQRRSAREEAVGIIDDLQPAERDGRRTGKIRTRLARFLRWDLMDPVRFSDLYGEHFKEVYMEVRNAENIKIECWNQAVNYVRQVKEDLGYKDSDLRKLEEETITVNLTHYAKPITMTKAQAINLYLAAKRQQGMQHLFSDSPVEPGGGFRPTDTDKYQYTRTYGTVPADVLAITNQLTTQEKALGDALQRFCEHDSSEWGNHASTRVYGYRKFTERHYWPLQTVSEYRRTEQGYQQGRQDATIAHLGFTNPLQEGARGPIMIDSVFNVFAKHITEMAAYSAYLEPLENLNKVYNWSSMRDGKRLSVKESMLMAWGKEGQNYLNELVRDINGQSRNERSSPLESLLSRVKGASVAANIRVVAQQPTAILKAGFIMPRRYLLMGLAGRTDTDEIYDNVPIARWKSWGYFRDGVNGSNVKELLIGKDRAVDRILDKSMAMAGAADNITWKAIYRGVQHWVAHDLKTNEGEEYRQEVQRRFQEVIDYTQVVDSVFQRTPAMRRQGFGWKLLTSFMSEPLKNLNMMVGAARDITNTVGGRQKGAKRRFLNSVVAFGSSALLNALIVSLVDVGRDDDDGEEFMDKYGQALFGDAVWNGVFRKEEDVTGFDVALGVLEGNLGQNLNPLGLVPLVSDILEMIQGYDYELMGISAIGDILDSASKMVKSFDEANSSSTIFKACTDFFLELSRFTGIPLDNAIRDIKSLFNYTFVLTDLDEAEEAMQAKFKIYKATMTPAKNKADYIALLRQAQLKGYDDLALQIRNYLISRGGMTRDQIQSQLTGLVSDEAEHLDLIERYAAAYNDNDVNQMQRIANEAEDAGIDGETLLDAAKKLNSSVVSSYADAYMAGDEVAMDEAAAQADRIGVDRDDLEEEALGDEADEEARQESVNSDLYADAAYTESYLYESLVNAILDGDSANESTIRKQLLQGGETEEDIEKRIQSDMKKALANQMGYEGIQDMEEAGDSFDTNSTGYRILHDEYGYTQYSYSDLADAYVQNNGSYDEILDDMLGQRSSGDNVYTEEKVEQNLKSQIQKRFNEIYDWGNGTGWEPYRDALRRLGKSWDEILDSFKRSQEDD